MNSVSKVDSATGVRLTLTYEATSKPHVVFRHTAGDTIKTCYIIIFLFVLLFLLLVVLFLLFLLSFLLRVTVFQFEQSQLFFRLNKVNCKSG